MPPPASIQPASHRLFLALPLSEPMRRQLSGFQEALKRLGCRGKFVPPEQLHLTLLFLGHADDAGLAALSRALLASLELPQALPLELELRQVASFRWPPRLLFAEFADPLERFAGLVQACRRIAAQAGFALEAEKEAVPHATLVRFRDPGEFLPCRGRLEVRGRHWRWQDPRLQPAKAMERIGELHLCRSTLRPEGPVHECLLRIPSPRPL